MESLWLSLAHAHPTSLAVRCALLSPALVYNATAVSVFSVFAPWILFTYVYRMVATAAIFYSAVSLYTHTHTACKYWQWRNFKHTASNKIVWWMKIWHWLSRIAIECYFFSFRTSSFRTFKVLFMKIITNWLIGLSLCGIHRLDGSSAPPPPHFQCSALQC